MRIETETPAERRLRALADDGRSGAGDFQQIDEAHGRACDMGREALAAGRSIVEAYDDYKSRGLLLSTGIGVLAHEVAVLRALLARAGEE